MASCPRDGERRVHPHCRVADGAAAGRSGGSRDKKGIANVTTMSSAEPTRRDFLYIATGAVAALDFSVRRWEDVERNSAMLALYLTPSELEAGAD